MSNPDPWPAIEQLADAWTLDLAEACEQRFAVATLEPHSVLSETAVGPRAEIDQVEPFACVCSSALLRCR